MSPSIPPGTPIGRIETSLDWLISHTTRFQGVILVRTSDGTGFILIEEGWPAAFYFRSKDQVIRGEEARRLLARHEFIQASLFRYTSQELRQALDMAGPGSRITGHPQKESGMLLTSNEKTGGGEGSPGSSARSRPGYSVPVEDEPGAGSGNPIEAACAPPPGGRDQNWGGILDRIVSIPGVSGAAVFREGVIVDSRGDASLANLVDPAEEVLLSVFEVLALLSAGSFIQVTIRLFGRNVTISPFNDGYLLVLTSPGINLGQIRKLVHDVAATRAA
jgi:predicted regulator of Ras-like GTPase activity (Roadblock/LC7/MglB family)